MRTKGKKEEEENASLKGSSYTIKRKTKRERKNTGNENTSWKINNLIVETGEVFGSHFLPGSLQCLQLYHYLLNLVGPVGVAY